MRRVQGYHFDIEITNQRKTKPDILTLSSIAKDPLGELQ